MSKGGRGAAHNVLMLRKSEDRRQEALKVSIDITRYILFHDLFSME